jgi:flavodoxin I
MKILILYATNSGGTEMAAQEIVNKLQGTHTVTLKRIIDTNPEEIQAHDLIVLGSPSWDYTDKEGQPHEDFFTFKKNVSGNPFDGKKIAIFGLGDSSYKVFTGAVDELEKWVLEWKGQKIVDSMRIDKFFFNQSEAMQKIDEWCGKVLEAIK